MVVYNFRWCIHQDFLSLLLAGFNSASTSFIVNLLILGPPGLRVAATVFGWVVRVLIISWRGFQCCGVYLERRRERGDWIDLTIISAMACIMWPSRFDKWQSNNSMDIERNGACKSSGGDWWYCIIVWGAAEDYLCCISEVEHVYCCVPSLGLSLWVPSDSNRTSMTRDYGIGKPRDGCRSVHVKSRFSYISTTRSCRRYLWVRIHTPETN